MKKIVKIKNACAVVALLYVSGATEETVLRVCKMHGFETDHGMDDEDWRDAAVSLNLRVRSVSLSPVRLNKFVKEYKTGLYLVGTHNHLFVVDNGLVVDPRHENPPGLDRVVKQAWTVKRL